MKNLITVILILCSIPMFAQQQRESNNEYLKEEMAKIQSNRLAMQLDLNEEQKVKLEALLSRQMEARKELRKDRIEERQELRKAQMQMNQEQKAKLREILTEAQFVKFEQLQEKRHRGRRKISEHREN